jgi:hypothetical protein
MLGQTLFPLMRFIELLFWVEEPLCPARRRGWSPKRLRVVLPGVVKACKGPPKPSKSGKYQRGNGSCTPIWYARIGASEPNTARRWNSVWTEGVRALFTAGGGPRAKRVVRREAREARMRRRMRQAQSGESGSPACSQAERTEHPSIQAWRKIQRVEEGMHR